MRHLWTRQEVISARKTLEFGECRPRLWRVFAFLAGGRERMSLCVADNPIKTRLPRRWEVATRRRSPAVKPSGGRRKMRLTLMRLEASSCPPARNRFPSNGRTRLSAVGTNFLFSCRAHRKWMMTKWDRPSVYIGVYDRNLLKTVR